MSWKMATACGSSVVEMSSGMPPLGLCPGSPCIAPGHAHASPYKEEGEGGRTEEQDRMENHEHTDAHDREHLSAGRRREVKMKSLHAVTKEPPEQPFGSENAENARDQHGPEQCHSNCLFYSYSVFLHNFLDFLFQDCRHGDGHRHRNQLLADFELYAFFPRKCLKGALEVEEQLAGRTRR